MTEDASGEGATQSRGGSSGEPESDRAPGFGRFGNVLLLTIVTSLTLMAAGLVGECAVRYRERHRTSVPDAHTSMYFQSVRYRHDLVRDFDYYGWLRINNFGFRGPDITLEKAPGTFRVIALGASTTFDTAVSPDEDAWPARLEHWLEEQAPELNVEVINAGISGFTVIDNLIRLQTELHRFGPDLIILFHTHNDLGSAIRPEDPPRDVRRPGEIPTITPWRRWLERNSLFYNKLMLRWNVMRFTANRGDVIGEENAEVRFDEILDQGAEGFERDLRLFLAAAEMLDIPVVLPSVVHVSGDRVPGQDDVGELEAWRRTAPTAPVEVVLRAYERYADVIREVADSAGVPYVDTRTFGLSGWEMFSPGDPVHFNNAGADLMGQRMAEALLQSGVLPVAAADSSASGR